MPRDIERLPKPLEAIGKTLALFRESAGMSQKAAAMALGTSQAAVSRWESGARCPALVDLPNIAVAYGVETWKLAKAIVAALEEVNASPRPKRSP